MKILGNTGNGWLIEVTQDEAANVAKWRLNREYGDCLFAHEGSSLQEAILKFQTESPEQKAARAVERAKIALNEARRTLGKERRKAARLNGMKL